MRIVVDDHRRFENTRLDQVDALSALRDANRMLAEYEAFTDAGTLVGIVRDGGFIPHDYDVDFGVIADWNNPGPLPDLRADFDPIRTVTTTDGRVMQRAYERDRVIVDLYFSWTGVEDGVAFNKTDAGVIRTPVELVRPFRPHWFKDVRLRVPGRTIDYLAWRYGPEWRTPIKEKLAFPMITPACTPE